MDLAELWAQYGPTMAMALIIVFVIKNMLESRTQRRPAGPTAYVAPERAAAATNPRTSRRDFGAAPQNAAPERANVSGAKKAIVEFSGVEMDDPNGLRVNNMVSSVKDLTNTRKSQIHFTYCGHSVGLVAKKNGSASVTIDGKNHEDILTPIHLNLSRQAICLGDRCVMWKTTKSNVAAPLGERSGSNGTPVLTIDGMPVKAKKAQSKAVKRSKSTAAAKIAAAAESRKSTAKSPDKNQSNEDSKSPIQTNKKSAANSHSAPAPAPAPTLVTNPSFVESLAGGEVVRPGTRTPSPVGDSYRGKIVGLYFSAHWCPPCRAFTPYLCSWFERFKNNHPSGSRLELLFISRDRSNSDFLQYHGSMNFSALPWGNQNIEGLVMRYGIEGIPALVLVDHKGDPISHDGRSLISQDPDGAGFPWCKFPLDQLCGQKMVRLPSQSKTSLKSKLQPHNTATSGDMVEVAKMISMKVSRSARGSIDLPITSPFKSFEAVLQWKERGDLYNAGTIPRQKRISNMRDTKLLVCHDMMGGYNQDRCPQGSHDPDIFRIYDWHLIDTFVYFSHNLVTIPTPGWTNAAHRSGVRVLGTFITEWEDGARVCSKIFMNKTIANAFASKLVEIAVYYKFDGYLVNIENPLSLAQVEVLKEFLKTLRKKLHEAIDDSMVIWYDAVTNDGQLVHQNSVTSKNKPMFDLADGIFLNYFWTPQHLTRTSVIVDKSKHKSVYAGIDVFGRNTYGGGGLKCHVALDEIEKAGLSVALFAPGWIFEDEQFDKSNFESNSKKFWSQFERNGLKAQPLAGFPIVTSFSAGRGDKFVIDGNIVKEQSWSNLSFQSTQLMHPFHRKINPYCPVLKRIASDEDTFKLEPVERDFSVAYQFGNSICFKGSVYATESAVAQNERAVYRLLGTNLSLSSPVCISYTYCVDDSSYPVEFGLLLICESGIAGKLPVHRYIQLRAGKERENLDEQDPETGKKLFDKYSLRPSGVIGVGEDTISLADVPDSASIHAIGEEERKWMSRSFVLCNKDYKDLVVKEIRLQMLLTIAENKRSTINAHLGEVKILKAASILKHNYNLTGISFNRARWSESGGNRCLSGILSWNAPAQGFDPCLFYDIWATNDAFIGRTASCSFTIQNHVVTANTKKIELFIQPCSVAGLKPTIKESPKIELIF